MSTEPVVIAREMQARFGADWLLWEPAVLWDALEEEGETTRAYRDKVMAIRTAIKSDSCWKNWNVFLATVRSLNGLEMRPDVPNYCTPAQIAYGLLALEEIAGIQPYDETVKAMAAAIVFRNGIYWLPESSRLRSFVQPYLDRILYSRIGPDFMDSIQSLKQRYLQWRTGESPISEDENSRDEAEEHAVRIALIEEYVERRSIDILRPLKQADSLGD